MAHARLPHRYRVFDPKGVTTYATNGSERASSRRTVEAASAASTVRIEPGQADALELRVAAQRTAVKRTD